MGRIRSWKSNRSANALALLATVCGATSAHAAVTISSAATQNMSCVSGTCAPTANNAVLNANDLESLLGSGNAVVTTTSSGVQANDIVIAAGVSWVSTHGLTLDAFHSIDVGAPMAITGGGGLTITTNDGGAGGIFNFAPGDNVDIFSLSSSLTINGNSYALVNSLASLASAIASNPAGNYALANNYNATGDGTYKHAPVPTEFSGAFEGLGNTVSNLTINSKDIYVGMFAQTGSGGQLGGSIENIVLSNVNVGGKGDFVGSLVGSNTGMISGAFANGSATSAGYQNKDATVGLLVGVNFGTISRSGAAGSIPMTKTLGAAGGLAGQNDGAIALSYADCAVSAGAKSDAGGLTARNDGSVSQSYALGSTKSGANSELGGLVGISFEQSTIAQSYSTAVVKPAKNGQSELLGGLIGNDFSPSGSNTSAYWDTQTSKVGNPSQGAGNIPNDPGITGLTTAQLKAGLPAGFDPTVWAENPSINSGFPYLINNPPQ